MKKTNRRKALKAIGQDVRNDRAYLYASRKGFNKEYCSSLVKRFSPEEIKEYEEKYLG